MSEYPKVSVYPKRKKVEEEIVEPVAITAVNETLKALVKHAPAFNPNATAKETGEFFAAYAEWLSTLKRAVE